MDLFNIAFVTCYLSLSFSFAYVQALFLFKEVCKNRGSRAVSNPLINIRLAHPRHLMNTVQLFQYLYCGSVFIIRLELRSYLSWKPSLLIRRISSYAYTYVHEPDIFSLLRFIFSFVSTLLHSCLFHLLYNQVDPFQSLPLLVNPIIYISIGLLYFCHNIGYLICDVSTQIPSFLHF